LDEYYLAQKQHVWRDKDKMADLLIETHPRFQKKGLPDFIKLSNLQNLLQDSLISTGHVEKAVIVNCSDTAITASTVGFKIDSQKAAMFANAFKSPALTRQRGLTYNGVQYGCVRADGNSVYARHESSGIILVHTESLVIVGFYNEHMYASVAVEAMEKLAEYLRVKGK
jgi:profilin